LLQGVSPGKVLNLPAAQFVQIPPKGPVEPALQAQSINASLPTGEFEFTVHDSHTSETAPTAVEYFPATQLLHAILPEGILYLPATHWLQLCPLPSVKPELQVQAIALLLPSGEFELVRQD